MLREALVCTASSSSPVKINDDALGVGTQRSYSFKPIIMDKINISFCAGIASNSPHKYIIKDGGEFLYTGVAISMTPCLYYAGTAESPNT